jgi:ATP-dependent DNA helicase RecG
MTTLDPLDVPLAKAVGGKTAKAFEAMDVRTVGDLLRHYPRRYLERGELTDLADLREGEHVTVMARIESVTTKPLRQRKGSMVEAMITDGRRRLRVTFFSQPWRRSTLIAGETGLFAGQVRSFNGRLELSHPECSLIPVGAEEEAAAWHSLDGRIVPIYPASKSMASWRIAKAVKTVLDTVVDLPDPIPEEVRTGQDLIELGAALHLIHAPISMDSVAQARRRLKFEEAFVLQALLARRRAETAAMPATRRAPERTPLLDAFDAALPFALTDGQRAVGEQLDADMARDHPMHRLLQGEVGSGKTIVALRAMLRVVDAGGQAALLAPTEVLAAQHQRTITTLLGPLADAGMLGSSGPSTRVALVTGAQGVKVRRRQLLDVVTGDAGIVIGTHALLEDKVTFGDLALVVIDEQHRFGVEQRAALAAKAMEGSRPHVLVMTATPIPRTVAMTVFGDLDVSTLAELPSGRAPVATHVVPAAEKPAYLERTWQRVREEVQAGHRVFVVCTRIGGDDSVSELTAMWHAGEDEDAHEVWWHGSDMPGPVPPVAVLDLARELSESDLAGLRVEVLHGRVSAADKDDIMRRFADTGAPDGIDVLVATTVVEVGVDIPAATTMVVMDADRYGMSQLHQLRGRVGRGGLPGLCLLVTNAAPGSPARERVEAVASTTDGFALSNLDLSMRREGDVLGASQSGRHRSLRLLEVARDVEVIEQARAAAAAVVSTDPTLARHPALLAAVDALEAGEQADFLEKG